MTTFKIEIDCQLTIMESWLVEMDNSDDPIFTFKLEFPKPSPGVPMSPQEEAHLLDFPLQHDPWLMREKFFGISDNPADALEFFKEYGVWRFSRFDGDEPANRFPLGWANSERDPLPIRFSELIYQRNYFEDALNCKPSDWLERACINTGELDRDAATVWEVMYLSHELDMSIVNLHGTIFPGPFMGNVSCGDIQDALRATVLLDWMEGREWPRCKACRRVFKRTSKHPQFYCCSACASRARQATFRKNRANHRGGRR